jgi:hypothetical protein
MKILFGKIGVAEGIAAETQGSQRYNFFRALRASAAIFTA